MTSRTSSLSITAPEPSQDSLGSQPCSPSQCCGSCQSESATAATTAVSNESASEPSKSDFSASTPNGLDSPIETVKGVASGKVMALVGRPTARPDHRGTVRETYRESWFPYVPPIRQLVQSNSKPKTLRGMHLHRKQWDIWRFVSDSALVRLVDHVSGDQVWIEAASDSVIAIPPGISHGFYTESGCILVYALTEEYTGSDEFGWYPFDGHLFMPAYARVKWPKNHSGLNISERDLRAPRLAEFRG